METGGMKGKRKEMIREELHTILCNGFGVSKIHSEYGMTELLSQAYSNGNGIFQTPPWMKILIRDTEDPFTILGNNKTGCRFIVVDAYNDERVIRYYTANGFIMLFSSESQEKEYYNLDDSATLATRLMFFDLILLRA